MRLNPLASVVALLSAGQIATASPLKPIGVVADRTLLRPLAPLRDEIQSLVDMTCYATFVCVIDNCPKSDI